MAAPFDSMPTGWWKTPSHNAKVRLAEAIRWERDHRRLQRRAAVTGSLLGVAWAAGLILAGLFAYEVVAWAFRR